MRGRHVTPLEADTCDDGDFQEVHDGWKMGSPGSPGQGDGDDIEDGWIHCVNWSHSRNLTFCGT